MDKLDIFTIFVGFLLLVNLVLSIYRWIKFHHNGQVKIHEQKVMASYNDIVVPFNTSELDNDYIVLLKAISEMEPDQKKKLREELDKMTQQLR
jgi:hypothetical protein